MLAHTKINIVWTRPVIHGRSDTSNGLYKSGRQFYLKTRSGNFDWSLFSQVLIPLKIATFLDQVICIIILKLYAHSICENRRSLHYSL